MPNWNEVEVASELDLLGRLFAVKFVPGGSNGLIQFFIEDDENYFLKMTVSHYWLDDLLDVVQKAIAIRDLKLSQQSEREE